MPERDVITAICEVCQKRVSTRSNGKNGTVRKFRKHTKRPDYVCPGTGQPATLEVLLERRGVDTVD